MTTALRRTTPFLYRFPNVERPHFVVDGMGLPAGSPPTTAFAKRLSETLDLTSIGVSLSSGLAEAVVREQYETGLEFMFTHPVWAAFREGQGQSSALAYVLETRHYLHAAPWRMSPGPAGSHLDDELAEHLAEHVGEEADHAIFFEDALAAYGCSVPVVQASRPAPTTLEWIYLMRTFGARDPVMAALVSGLMEMSAADHDVVKGWHERIIERGVLPREVVTAMRRHVDLDIELGHGSNWLETLQMERDLPTKHLARCLNAISTVAEVIVRWTDSLSTGLSATAIELMRGGEGPVEAPSASPLDVIVCPDVVWPAPILHDITHGTDGDDGYKAVLASAYFLPATPKGRTTSPVHVEAERLRSRVGQRVSVTSGSSLKAVVKTWLASVDGHQLWDQLQNDDNFALVYGWLIENYHYLAASPRHVCAGIATCPDVVMRASLVKHLQEEAGHHKLIGDALTAARTGVPLARSRPLATTEAFIGYLRELAEVDWKAYCLGLGFLQFSFEPKEPRHKEFYDAVVKATPSSRDILRGIQRHDELDASLGHDGDMCDLMDLLAARHDVGEESLRRAAQLPALTWSFLDGIRTHYSAGPSAIAQRIGWRG